MNRLTDAKHYNAAHVFKNNRFNETIKNTIGTPGYDMNGNIVRLVRNGDKPGTTPNPQGTIDQLTYSYVGNQLKVVNDAIADNANETGFKELVGKSFNVANTDAQNECAYDKNGNMTKDDNKGITAITYNHLNLPVQVNKGATNHIVYTYDATGGKLKQQVFWTTPKTTEYIGEYVYEGGALKFVSH